MNTTQRPWEGTALGIINIIGVICAFLGAIAFLFLQGIFTSIMGASTSSGEPGITVFLNIIANFGMIAGVVLIGIGILAIFLARGSFRGQKWTVVVNLIFAILGALSGLNSMGMMGGTMLGNLAVNAFAIYCSVMCLKNAYYK